MILKLGMEHYVPRLYRVYTNDDSELTLTYFMTMSNFAELVFVFIVGQISGERLQDHWSSGYLLCRRFSTEELQVHKKSRFLCYIFLFQ